MGFHVCASVYVYFLLHKLQVEHYSAGASMTRIVFRNAHTVSRKIPVPLCFYLTVSRGYKVRNSYFVWFGGYKSWPDLILLSLCPNESNSRLSSGHQEASSPGLKRPEAEVTQLFLWLFKDNLHWELWSHSEQSVPAWYCNHVRDHSLRLAWLISMDDISVPIFHYAHVWLLLLQDSAGLPVCAWVIEFSLWYPLFLKIVNMHDNLIF